MSYLILISVVLYGAWLLYGINFIARQQGIKAHEKGFWIFIFIAVPLFALYFFSSFLNRRRSRLAKSNYRNR